MSPEGFVALAALIVSILGAMLGLVWRASSRIARIEHAVYPNSGSSLRDRVDALEKGQAVLTTYAEDQRDQLRRIWQLLDNLTGK